MQPVDAFKRALKRAFRPSLSIAYDNLALQMLKTYDFGYLPWTAAAMRPAALCVILNEIIINQRRTIVEFGCGISTLYIAATLREHGGSLCSFEHDAGWAEMVSGQLRRHKLQDFAVVIHSPLGASSLEGVDSKWYDEATVAAALSDKKVDGVVVDGPPASSPSLKLARYPAIPVIQPFLSEEFFVYLDDMAREGETEVFRRWCELLNLAGEIELVAGQYGMLRKGSRFAVTLSREWAN